jgi:CBS domain-containing protein
MRRGQWVVRGIQASLDSEGLVTEPDFESAYIDSHIEFALMPTVTAAVGVVIGVSDAVAVGVADGSASATPVAIGIADPTYRLSRLSAANRTPVSVAPDRPLVDAVTLMMSNDFSQLQVMTSERTVKGVISWRSIGARWALGKDGDAVRDFMDEFHEVPSERSIFAALPTIVERGYVLVKDPTSRICGIVTTSDLSLQFQQLAEPFLLLGEIENHIRRLLDGKFTTEELSGARDPNDSDRIVDNVADLTFGEYLRLLQDSSRWAKVGIAIDRAIFVKELDAVRIIRNDVMHFDPDPLPDSDLQTLRRFATFLQALQRFSS